MLTTDSVCTKCHKTAFHYPHKTLNYFASITNCKTSQFPYTTSVLCALDTDVHVTVHRDKILIKTQPDALFLKFLKFILERNSTCFGQFLCPSSGVFHCTHSNGICHTGLLAACEQRPQTSICNNLSRMQNQRLLLQF